MRQVLKVNTRKLPLQADAPPSNINDLASSDRYTYDINPILSANQIWTIYADVRSTCPIKKFSVATGSTH